MPEKKPVDLKTFVENVNKKDKKRGAGNKPSISVTRRKWKH